MCGRSYVHNKDIRVGKSFIHGKGVFANKEYQAGSEVAYFEGHEVDHDTRHSLALDGKKIEPTGPLKYLNHSCDANSYFRGRTLVTRKKVEPSEELTINYLETEDNISHPFKCKCMVSNCKKKICSILQ